MEEIRTEIDIDAPPGEVWAVLSDLASYPEWNPFMRRVRGELKTGGRLEVVARVDDGPTLIFRPRLLRIDPPRELRWLGELPLPGLFHGDHRFRIEPLGDARSRFVQSEKFSGVLMPFMGWLLRQNRTGYVQMNEALKARVER